MLNLDEVRLMLQDRSTPVVAERTGIHPNTIRAIKNGKPVVMSDILERLSDYLEGKGEQ